MSRRNKFPELMSSPERELTLKTGDATMEIISAFSQQKIKQKIIKKTKQTKNRVVYANRNP